MAFHSDAIRQTIETGGAYLGIELGSTRIKAVLIGEEFAPIASGSYGWENQYVDQTWTYDLETIHAGVRACYADLARDVRERYGLTNREAEVLVFLARGFTPAYIAKSLVLSVSTVRTHVRNIYRKLNVNKREELIHLIDEG